jgi:hypothetical protein
VPHAPLEDIAPHSAGNLLRFPIFPSLRTLNDNIKIDLSWCQSILGQGPSAVASDERLKSRVRNRLRALKSVKHQAIELKVLLADGRSR